MNTEYSHITTEILQLVNSEQAWKYGIVPFQKEPNCIYFYTENDIDSFVREELELLFSDTLIFKKIPSPDFQTLLQTHYRKQNNTNVFSFSNSSDTAFIKKLIEEAHHYEASDIHIEVFEERCRIRYRIDGKLIEKYVLQKQDYPLIVNKIKIEANLDIAEKRLPQDGRIFYKKANSNAQTDKFDVRVSCLPTLYGEKIVMRLLAKDEKHIDLSSLGLSEKQYDLYTAGIKKNHGIILISGPTGSGKTTTLYSTLKILNKSTQNILTVEDPIEYTLEGVNQVQVNDAIGLNYTTALRSFLRQDPDIIMLGEIRDAETAQMAIRSALTGHLVFSTIHTNSAWGTISRLIDMGIPAYLLSNTLILSIAQRLVRVLCNHCKQEIDFNPSLLPHVHNIPDDIHTIYQPVGCEHCFHTGYKGRKALYEIIPIDSDFAKCIRNNTFDITSFIEDKKVTTLQQSAYELLRSGATSVEEIYPIVLSV